MAALPRMLMIDCYSLASVRNANFPSAAQSPLIRSLDTTQRCSVQHV
jgi:hypothetical protein